MWKNGRENSRQTFGTLKVSWLVLDSTAGETMSFDQKMCLKCDGSSIFILPTPIHLKCSKYEI